jgi:serine protease AprX
MTRPLQLLSAATTAAAILLAGALAPGCAAPVDSADPAGSAATSTTEEHLLSLAPIDSALAAVLASSPLGARHRVVLTLDGSRTASALASAVSSLGGGVLGFSHLPLLAASLTAPQIALVRSLLGVRGLYLDRPLELMLAQSRATMHADQVVTELGVTGAGVGVAILDSGVDGTHANLSFPSKTRQNVKVLANLDELFEMDLPGGALVLENLPDTDTSTGHGTHVANIVGGGGTGAFRGVAPGANVIGVSTGDGLSILWALSGIDWILTHRTQYGIRVVNNSWGTTGVFDGGDPINTATRAMHDAGITVVFAAGNEGSAQNTLNPYSVAPWVIGVAAGCKTVSPDPTSSAADCNDGRAHQLADFSSRGIPGDAVYHPTITAPGVNIVSARSKTGTVMNALDLQVDATTCAIGPGDLLGYTCASGTSMAAPHIAGVVALMLQANPALTPDQVKAKLRSTARPMPGYGEWEVGAGYVDALAAVKP